MTATDPPRPATSRLRRTACELRIAVAFLTRLPVGGDIPQEDWVLGRALWAFPLVGLLIGGAGAGVLIGLDAVRAPAPLAALSMLAFQILLTGALHEDGLADVADGFGGGRTPVRRREIMKDSRIGSYGALALILSIGIRTAALSALTAMGWQAVLIGLPLIGAISRSVMVWEMGESQAVGTGLASRIGKVPSSRKQRLLGLLAMATMTVTLPAQWQLLAAASVGFAGVLGLSWGLRRWSNRMIGGHTGDVLGAHQQLTEMLLLGYAAILIPLVM